MAQHGVSGAFLQRFAGQCEVDGGTGGNAAIMALRDEVGRHVRRAAEDEGRVWAVMYDVSGVPAARILHVLTTDWAHLLSTERVLASPAYLHDGGAPVLALWGFGFAERGHTPALVRDVVRALRALTPGGKLYVMAGAPAHWRTGQGDADPDPGFLDVWLNEFDAISPWSVGRYADEDAADAFARENVRKDMALLADGSRQRRGAGGMSARKVDYVPVVFPGFSVSVLWTFFCERPWTDLRAGHQFIAGQVGVQRDPAGRRALSLAANLQRQEGGRGHHLRRDVG